MHHRPSPAEAYRERAHDECRYIELHARIDLDAFLALDGEARGARWRQWDRMAKEDAVIQMINRGGGEWTDDLVEHWVAYYDAKWEVASPASDETIPPAATIIEAASEAAEEAKRCGDLAGARQLDRVRANVLGGARLMWVLGELLIQSINNPGVVYSVDRAGCTCPARSFCWHRRLYELLVSVREDAGAAGLVQRRAA